MSIAHICDYHLLDSRQSSRQITVMTKQTPPRFHLGLPERLAAEGLSDPAARALLDLDVALFLWHRMSAKGEIPGKLIAELGLDLELTHFHALTAITRIEAGIESAADRPDGGGPRRGTAGVAPHLATIGLLAEEMNIDPSRASRIAADLIQRGYLRREAVQADGRKTVLVLTDKADTDFGRFRDRKWDKMVDLFKGWSEDDIIRFSTLFSRYCDGLREIYTVSGQDGPPEVPEDR